MIALAVISVAMISLLSLGNRSIAVHDRLQRLTVATLLAQQKMAETEVNSRQESLSTLDSEGVFDAPHANFRWQLTFADTPLPSVQMVTVTVSWGEESQNELVDITSFLF